MEVSGQLHAPAALPPGKAPRYSLDRRLGGPQSRFERCEGDKNLVLPGIEPGPSTREKYISVKNTVHTLELEVGECRIYMVSLMRAAATFS
jgi:hypothetical protein